MEDVTQGLTQVSIVDAPSKSPMRAKEKKWRLRPPTDRKHHQWCGWYIDGEWARSYGRLQEIDLDSVDVGYLAAMAVEQLTEYSGYKGLSVELAYPPANEPDSAMFTVMAICGSKPYQRQRPNQTQLDKLLYIMGEPPMWFIQADFF